VKDDKALNKRMKLSLNFYFERYELITYNMFGFSYVEFEVHTKHLN
jgi:hypothetical protein